MNFWIFFFSFSHFLFVLISRYTVYLSQCHLFCCQLKGSVDDCSCSIDTVDFFNNNKIYPRLKSLLVRDYFRFYKVNLKKDCPFWTDDSRCAMRSCHVSTCEEKDIPEGLKGHHQQESFFFKVNKSQIFVFNSVERRFYFNECRYIISKTNVIIMCMSEFLIRLADISSANECKFISFITCCSTLPICTCTWPW